MLDELQSFNSRGAAVCLCSQEIVNRPAHKIAQWASSLVTSLASRPASVPNLSYNKFWE